MSDNLHSRIDRLQAQVRTSVKREARDFMRWLNSLTIEDHTKFLEFIIPELFPEPALPSHLLDLSVEERFAWVNEFVRRRRAEAPLTEHEELAFHARARELRRVWLQSLVSI